MGKNKLAKLNRLHYQLAQRSLVIEASLVADLQDNLYKEAGIIDDAYKLIEDIKNNPEISYCWGLLSISIPWNIIKNNPEFPWIYSWVSRNPNITIDNVLDNIDKPWDWEALSENINMDNKSIKKTDKWKYPNLFLNPNYKKDKIYNTEFIYNYAMNPNLKYEDIDLVNKNNIIYNQLYYNPYFTSETYKKKLVKKFMKKCGEQLIAKSCHPSRIKYWHEDAVEMFGDSI
jgi:hypothetical protein